MAVATQPKSSGSDDAKRGGRYQVKLAREARTQYSGAQLTGDLYARIIWFHAEPQGDIDNFVKPILDSLIGIVYHDDSVIVRCLAERVDLRGASFSIAEYPSIAADVYSRLEAFLGQSHNHILYVEVGQIGEQVVRFGPVDEGGR